MPSKVTVSPGKAQPSSNPTLLVTLAMRMSFATQLRLMPATSSMQLLVMKALAVGGRARKVATAISAAVAAESHSERRFHPRTRAIATPLDSALGSLRVRPLLDEHGCRQ